MTRADELRQQREAQFSPAKPLRKTPLGRRPRSKGNRGELEIIKLFQKWGWSSARRNFQSGGQGGGDVINGPEGSHEVKRRETLNIWAAIAQSKAAARPSEQWFVWFRRNGETDWKVAMDAEFALMLLREHEDRAA